MEMGSTDCASQDQLPQRAVEGTTSNYCSKYKTGSNDSKCSASLTSRFKHLKKKKLYRGVSWKAFGAEKPGNYSIFDSPGSDRFHFEDRWNDQNSSKHGSVVSLEWDSQDCYKDVLEISPHITINPLSLCHPSLPPSTPSPAPDTPLVSLDSSTCTAMYSDRQVQVPGGQSRSADSCHSTMWDEGHGKQMDLLEFDSNIVDKETETLLHEIETLTSQALRETNRWNFHVNQMTEDEQNVMTDCDTKHSVHLNSNNDDVRDRKDNSNCDTLTHHLTNQNKSKSGEIPAISTDTPSPMSISVDSGNF
eukprot:GFUD01022929.1.p1 GENE.GFUD01022929.1~~GFUD01022929.1.p1  ORF type:complete len:312 (+),score=96.37 GFUD01022929.1:23-937(+)